MVNAKLQRVVEESSEDQHKGIGQLRPVQAAARERRESRDHEHELAAAKATALRHWRRCGVVQPQQQPFVVVDREEVV